MSEMSVENEKREQISGGEAKAREYANRIIDEGEEYHSIVNGLGPTMTAAIHAAIERRGYDIPTEQQEQLEGKEKFDFDGVIKTPEQVVAYVADITENRPEQVQELYKRLLENSDNDEQRMILISALMGDTYRNLRTADYGIHAQEEENWEQAKRKDAVPVRESSEWMYRGIFPEGDGETVTRGSFNVTVTPDLVDSLDAYIASGKVKANYKFGQPGTGASPQERHDAISIYFLEQPSEEVLQELSNIIAPYVRGGNLLGREVAEGFSLSEIGSIQDEHIKQFVEMLDGVDSSFAEAVKRYASDRKGRTAMSEAQYYAVKKVAKVFGYDLAYNNESGFVIHLLGEVE